MTQYNFMHEEPTMNKKFFLKSKGFWGPVVALFSLFSMQMGWGEIDQSGVVQVIEQITLWGGVAGSWIGRAMATSGWSLKP